MKYGYVFLGLSFAFVLSACASTEFTGKSSADETLREDTLKVLRPYVSALHGCNSIDAVHTDIRTLSKSGAVTEHWMVSSCEKKSGFDVRFTPDPTGVSINISPDSETAGKNRGSE